MNGPSHYHPDSRGTGAIEHEDTSPGHLGRSYRRHFHGVDGKPAPDPTGNPSVKELPKPGYLSSARLERAPIVRVPTELARRLREDG